MCAWSLYAPRSMLMAFVSTVYSWSEYVIIVLVDPSLSCPLNVAASIPQVFSLVNLKCNEMMAALRNFYNLLVPGVYAVFAYTGHGCTYQNINYLIPVDAHGADPDQCISTATVFDSLQRHLCRVFVFLDCCRVKRYPAVYIVVLSVLFLCIHSDRLNHSLITCTIHAHNSTEDTTCCPRNSRKYNFANLFEICSWWVPPIH